MALLDSGHPLRVKQTLRSLKSHRKQVHGWSLTYLEFSLKLGNRNHSEKLINKLRALRNFKNKAIKAKKRFNRKLRSKEIDLALKEAPRYNFHSEGNNQSLDDLDDCIISNFSLCPETLGGITASTVGDDNTNYEINWYQPPNSKIQFIPYKLDKPKLVDLEKIKVDFGQVISDSFEFGKAKVEPFDIELIKGGEEYLSKHRPKPFPVRGEMFRKLKTALSEMEEASVGTLDALDVIYASPCFFVKQKRKSKLRLCVAFNDLNKMTVDFIYPLPLIDNVLDQLRGHKYFAIIDLKSGYWQCPLTKKAMRYLATITSCGTFKWFVVPFGAKNAPAYFQRIMNIVLSEGIGKFCMVYIDDIVVYSKTWEEHVDNIRKVFTMLAIANLKVNWEKCHLALLQLKLLGRIVNGMGVTTDPELVKDMVEFPTPRNFKQVKQFLALLGHYRHFIKDFQTIAAPLFKLTRKDVDWKWSEKQDDCFNKLKQLMTSALVLAHPDWSKEFVITINANKIGIGGVISQYDSNNKLHPIAFYSKMLLLT